MRYNLSEINEVIKDRRTIYPETYSDRKVHKEQVELILNNALWAPTHGMTQPWRYKVFMGDPKSKLRDLLVSCYVKNAGDRVVESKKERTALRVDKSSAVIAICMQKDPNEKILEIEEVEAVACSVQNMYLTATAYGLGAFWSTPKFIYKGWVDEFLGLNDDQVCLGFFYLGYPGEEWPKGQRRPLEYVTEWRV